MSDQDNMTNVKFQALDAEPFVTVSHVVVGATAVILNAVALFYVSRLQAERPTSFTVQMMFICAVDIGSGLAFCLRPMIRVTDMTGAFICAFSIVTVVAFDNVSKGNIFCICLQRYMFARHIGTTVATWRISHTIRMAAVANILVGVFVMATVSPMLDATKGVYPMTFCTFATLLKNNGPNTFILLTVFQISSMFASDVLCFMTVWKLRRAANAVRHSVISSTMATNDSCNAGGHRLAKTRQEHAMWTVLIILVVLNLSYIPITFVNVFNICEHVVDPTVDFHGLLMLSTLIPYYVNPVMIAVRMQDIRNMIQSDFRQVRTYLNQLEMANAVPCADFK